MKILHSLILAVLFWTFTGPATLFGQSVHLGRPEYNVTDGIIKLGWGSSLGSVYGLESSANLVDWLEMKGASLVPLRFTGTAANRIDLEISAPAADARFYRVRKLSVVHVAAGRDFENITLNDVNDAGRVAGFFGSLPTRGFTWAPGEQFVSFGDNTRAMAVNELGVVVGSTNIYVAAQGTLIPHFFTWTSIGGMTVHDEGLPVGINASGHIAGYEVDPNRRWTRAFFWKPGTGKIYLPHLDPASESTLPHALSDAGQIVGDSLIDQSYYRAFYWTEAGGIVDIAGAQSNAVDVNKYGQVIGQRVLSDGSSRAYVWTATGGIVNLPATVSYPTDINDQGQVTGSSSLNAFLWTRSEGIIELGTLSSSPALSNGLRVNENGHVTGDSIVEGGFAHPFYWSPSAGMVRLDTITVGNSGAVLINNNDMIFGYGSEPNSTRLHILMWDMRDPR